MSEFSIKIKPDVPSGLGAILPKSETLCFEDFEGKNQPRRAEYIFDNIALSYGESSLYQIYIDICEEMDKLESGGDHDFEMSYYPVARVIDLGQGLITLGSLKKEQQNGASDKVWSRGHIVELLLRSKRRIERFANVSAPSTQEAGSAHSSS